MRTSPCSIAVIGLGAWGSALALHAARCGHSVIGWHRDERFVSQCQSSKSIPCAQATIPLPDNVSLTTSLAATQDAEITIIALPSAAWAELLPKLRNIKILVSATKGLEKSSGKTPLTFASQTLSLTDESLCVISGPSFASDLSAARPLSVTAASKSQATATAVAAALSGDYLRVYTSTDPLGVELGGILKNVIAIACGVSDSLGFGPSARAALIARGLAEMSRLSVALGADARTLAGLSGLGDLVMTATEDQSRNRQVGLRLGRGEKIEEIVVALGSTAEGVTTAPLVQQLAAQAGIETPITDLVVKLIKRDIPLSGVAKALMSRPLRSEI